MPAQPKHIRAFEVRLEANWSCEDVVQMLSPDFVSSVLLESFPALESTIKMRALVAFLGSRTDHPAFRRDQLLSLLGMGDDDKDEWVQVVSGLVRRKLMSGGADSAEDRSEKDGGRGENAGYEISSYSAAVSRRTVTDVLARAKRSVDELTLERIGDSRGGGIGAASYFNPWEERYVCKEQQIPREEFANPHFTAKYDFVNEFAEDLSSSWHVSNASLPSSVAAAATAIASSLKSGQGGLSKPTGGNPQGATSAPNLAKARRVSMSGSDLSVGSDGLRRTSKPIALAHKNVGLQPGSASQGHHIGHKNMGIAGGSRGARGGSGVGGSKMGVVLLNTDEILAIDSEKQSAKEKARARPGRKKAKLNSEGQASFGEASAQDSGVDAGQQVSLTAGRSYGALKAEEDDISALCEGDEPKQQAETEGPAIPAAGEIEAAAAMMVLGVASGDESTGTYLPPALSSLLADANSIPADGMQKLENFFQKKNPEGCPQERVKYHEEVTTGEDGERTRVTSYIRLDYGTWMWDRVHKKKRLK